MMITKERVYVLIILCLTGFSLGALAPSIVYILLFLGIFSLEIFKIKSFKIKNYKQEYSNLVFISTPFIVILIIQFNQFGNIPQNILIEQIGKFVLYFLISFFILKDIKYQFHLAFVDVMYFLALISLFFYPTQFIPSLQEMIGNTLGSVIRPLGYSSGEVPDTYISKTLIFFTYHHNYGHPITGIPRNSGAFWEPGVFGFFLVLALAINLFINKKSLFIKCNVIFILVIITTFSTTAVLACSLIIFYYYIFSLKLSLQKKILIGGVLGIIFFSGIWQQDFVSGKIFERLDDAETNMGSRFGAVVYHFLLVKDNLNSGVGLKYLYELKNSDFNYLNSASNGISVILMFWGIFGFLIYFSILYLGIKKWILNINIFETKHHNFIFFIFLFISFSQALTMKIFFFFILTFFIVFSTKEISKEGKYT